MIPERRILFGSRARGDDRLDSDYDLMVVIDAGSTVDEREAAIRRRLLELGVPADAGCASRLEYPPD